MLHSCIAVELLKRCSFPQYGRGCAKRERETAAVVIVMWRIVAILGPQDLISC